MGNHHDNNHSTEKKPVAFTVPFILGLVTITAILSLVSLGDPCHCKEECGEECKKECKHEAGEKEGHGEEAHGAEKAAEPAKEEAHH